jgi:hypothetical protein
LIFVWLYRLFPSLLEAAVVFKPETLVRWPTGSPSPWRFGPCTCFLVSLRASAGNTSFIPIDCQLF